MSGDPIVLFELGGEVAILATATIFVIRAKAPWPRKAFAFLALCVGCLPIYLTGNLPYNANRAIIVGSSYSSLCLAFAVAILLVLPRCGDT